MHRVFRISRQGLAAVAVLSLAQAAAAQGNSGVVSGTVQDGSGAAIAGATVSIANAVSGFSRTQVTDAQGRYFFANVPFNPYRVSVSDAGFASSTQDVVVRSVVPVSLSTKLAVGAASQSVDVVAPADLVERDPNFHTDIDRTTIARLPTESVSSELSSIVTQLSPGVAADSNGLLHGMGDHNEVSFNVDGQPITDQQSKVFSNQLPADAVQSLQVIEGAPPAEFGDKTSLVIVATTRSGLGVAHPTGAFTAKYGSFGTTNIGLNLAVGNQRLGNFFSINGLGSGRFLDAPEFAVYHDKGNEQNFFDRVDFQLSDKDTLHSNVQYTRSQFQTPNSYDQQFGFVASGMNTRLTDQRSKIETYLVAPTYTHTVSDSAVFNFAPYFRHDAYHYIPSGNPLNDFGPIQQESVAQFRTLLNAGVHADLSYVKGMNTAKFGGMYQHTILREHDSVGIVDPGFNDPTTAAFNPVLAPYDLTRGGTDYGYFGHADVKQLALYAQDQVKAGNFLVNFGVRGDFYNGLRSNKQVEPRAGVSYNVTRTNTVLRVSYARTQETPFNENLVLSSQGCNNPVLFAIFTAIGPCIPAAFNVGTRNEFHAGFQQELGRRFVVSADYIWKYTHNGYDFSVLGATPITFPIEWHNSKIPGFALSGTLTNYKGLSGRVTMSSVAARFFNPQLGGVGATPGAPNGLPFRIDHDERFNQTTHLEYALPFRKSLYYSFNWKFDSGLVAGAVPCYNVVGANAGGCAPYSFDANGNPLTLNGKPELDLGSLTPDEEFTAGLACDGVRATYRTGFAACDAAGLTSNLVTIPGINQEDDDHSPQRIAHRNLFDMEVGDDKLMHMGANDRYRLSAKVSAINVTNKYALYNFLSTFSGTHYVSPRTVTGEVAFHF